MITKSLSSLMYDSSRQEMSSFFTKLRSQNVVISKLNSCTHPISFQVNGPANNTIDDLSTTRLRVWECQKFPGQKFPDQLY